MSDGRDGDYGRKPVPADEFVRWTLERSLEIEREARIRWATEMSEAKLAAERAIEGHLRCLGRISHLEAAIAALDIPEPPSPSPRTEFERQMSEGVALSVPKREIPPGTMCQSASDLLPPLGAPPVAAPLQCMDCLTWYPAAEQHRCPFPSKL
jgi:hypothetical protein